MVKIARTLLCIYIETDTISESSWVDERDLSHMVYGPTFLSLTAWRQGLLSRIDNGNVRIYSTTILHLVHQGKGLKKKQIVDK